LNAFVVACASVTVGASLVASSVVIAADCGAAGRVRKAGIPWAF
jgi:hypothetical protein